MAAQQGTAQRLQPDVIKGNKRFAPGQSVESVCRSLQAIEQ